MECKTRKLKYIAHYSFCFFLTLIIFIPWLNNYFTSDDWPVISRNLHVSWSQVPSWFISIRFGWYRPLYEVFVALCWQLFGLSTLGYRLLSIVLYALVSANVGVIMYLLVREKEIAIWASIMFCILAPHAEPVLWFAATNELLAALFVSTSFISYLVFRKTEGIVWLVTSVLSWCLAITSKETTIFFPLALLTYDLLFVHKVKSERSLLRTLIPSMVISLIGVGFIMPRLLQGSPYSITATVPRLLMNLVFYILISVFALPSNYAYVASLPLWQTSPTFPIVTLLCSTSAIVVALWIWLQKRQLHIIQQRTRALAFSIAWTVSALLPVIPIVAERTVFLSSIGVVMTLSLLFVSAWKCAKEYNKQLARGLTLLLLLYIGINALTLEYRCTWWGKASEASEALVEKLATQINDVPINNEIILVNLPDHIEYAYTFRNAFPELATVLNYKNNIRAILDAELVNLTADQQEEYISKIEQEIPGDVFWYKDGTLVLDR